MVTIYVLKEKTSYFLLQYQIEKFWGQKSSFIYSYIQPLFHIFTSIISGKEKYLKDSTMLCVRTKQRAAHGIPFLGIWVRKVGWKNMVFSENIRYSYKMGFILQRRRSFCMCTFMILYRTWVWCLAADTQLALLILINNNTQFTPLLGILIEMVFEIITLEGYWWGSEAQQQLPGQKFFLIFFLLISHICPNFSSEVHRVPQFIPMYTLSVPKVRLDIQEIFLCSQRRLIYLLWSAPSF